jgi:hypothetical protein
LGFDPAFACFSSKVLAEFDEEEEAFSVIMTVYKAFQLDQYYAPEANADYLQNDVRIVLETLAVSCPTFAGVCAKERNQFLLMDLVKDWLRSLFSLAFNAGRGQPGDYGPILKHICQRAVVEQGDVPPRGVLRDLAIFTLTKYHKMIEAAADKSVLSDYVDGLRNNLVIDLTANEKRSRGVRVCSSDDPLAWVPMLSTMGYVAAGEVLDALGGRVARVGKLLGELAASYAGHDADDFLLCAAPKPPTFYDARTTPKAIAEPETQEPLELEATDEHQLETQDTEPTPKTAEGDVAGGREAGVVTEFSALVATPSSVLLGDLSKTMAMKHRGIIDSRGNTPSKRLAKKYVKATKYQAPLPCGLLQRPALC